MSRVLNLWAGMTGTVLDFAGTTAPADWLLCFGQAVGRATYPNLFAVIGTTYGVGDGSTTFNLPDSRGRAAIGKDDMGGTAASRVTAGGGGIAATTLGATGGTETQALTTAQMPTHNHSVTDPGHNHTLSDPGHVHGLSDPGHSHVQQLPDAGGGASWNNMNGASTSSTVWDGLATLGATTGITMATHATGITQAAASTGITTQNNGTGNAHPNVQPGIVFNKIIKI